MGGRHTSLSHCLRGHVLSISLEHEGRTGDLQHAKFTCRKTCNKLTGLNKLDF